MAALALNTLLTILLCLPTTAATTLYVSPNGNNTNDGYSSTTALRTLLAASQHQRLHDTITSVLLERDATYINDPLTLFLSGSHPFLLSSYGDPTTPRPLLQHARGLNNLASSCVRLSGNLTGLQVSELHLSGCSRGLVLASSTPTSTNITVQNNVFQDIRTPFLSYTPPNPKWSPALLLDGGNLINLTVKNNVAARIDVFFSSTGHVTNMNLDSNTVQQCSGNCYSLGAGSHITLQNSVFLRDMSTRLFLYGTTDVIVGGLTGQNKVINNDFNQRGEYQSGPDGCAFDFETAATGFEVSGNTFSRSFGAGIMVFGHSTTSKNITIAQNVFDRSGCTQARADQGGIAVMCPNGHKPTGIVRNNTFFQCDSSSSNNAPAIYVAPNVPGCAEGLDMVQNAIYKATEKPNNMCTIPQLNLNPPPPTDMATSGTNVVVATSVDKDAVIRYTTNGARPTENDPIVPAGGIQVRWPSNVVHINVRAFKEGMLPSITNGALIPLNYGFGRMSPDANIVGPNNDICGKGIVGNIDSFNVSKGSIAGWALDYLSRMGSVSLEPVIVRLLLDGDVVGSALSNGYRPDLVHAGVAPDAYHGFSFLLSKAVQTRASSGSHTLAVQVVGSSSSVVATDLSEKSNVVCQDGKCK